MTNETAQLQSSIDTSSLVGALASDETRLAEARRSTQELIDDAERQSILARTHSVRRAEVIGSRDNPVFRLGSAFETADALCICDVALVALLRDPIAVAWTQEAQRKLHGSQPHRRYDTVDGWYEVLADRDRRRYLTHKGAWLRWRFLANAYRAAVEEFESSAQGRDPAAKWRFGRVTAKQRYMIDRICHLLAADEPDFERPYLRNAGEAHFWIAAVGGNPRFRDEPIPPAWPQIEARQTLEDA